MARYFLDTNVILYRYYRSGLAEGVQRDRDMRMERFAGAALAMQPVPLTSTLTLLEARGTLARLSKSFPEIKYSLEVLDVDEPFLEVWEPTTEDWAQAMSLAVGHALKAPDALQCAVFLRARNKYDDLTLATADLDLVRAATELAVPCLDPSA